MLDDLEQRRIPKVAGELPVIRRTDGGKTATERLSELSMGGLTLLTDERLSPDARVELTVKDDDAHQVELQGTVIGTRVSVADLDVAAAIRFDPLEPIAETQLRDLLVRMLSIPDRSR